MAKKKSKANTKVAQVMREYKGGSLRSGSGGKVTSGRQALAIALSEAGVSRKRKSKGKKK